MADKGSYRSRSESDIGGLSFSHAQIEVQLANTNPMVHIAACQHKVNRFTLL
jgi:hypothetical protein